LIIRLDEIGDFVLFHNFIRIIKQSKKYQNYRISLCGNISWKDLAEKTLQDSVDHFIWIDKKQFEKNLRYKYQCLRTIYSEGFSIMINPHYTRGILYDDTIVRASKAPSKIGSQGSPESHTKWKRNLFTDKYYTQLIPQSSDILFEFFRNKEFCETLLEKEIEIHKPILQLPKSPDSQSLNKDTIVIFPGAGNVQRQWNIDKFVEICRFILANSQHELIICGSEKEIHLSKIITGNLDDLRVVDLAGKTNLIDLAAIIENSQLLVSNETGAVHLAAALETPFICLSNGRFLGRFHPYPSQIFNKGQYLYPPAIMNNLNNIDELKRQYSFDSPLNINDISVELVQSAIKKTLSI
jgi:ADP-heptose:LPS heptosyltransferase